MTELSIEPFANADLDGLVAVVDAEGGSACAVDVERTSRALSSSGVTTLLAIGDGWVVGATGVQSDGVIQAYVSVLLVDPNRGGPQFGFGLLRVDSSVQEPAARYPYPDRGLLRAVWRERLAAVFRVTREHFGLRATDSPGRG